MIFVLCDRDWVWVAWELKWKMGEWSVMGGCVETLQLNFHWWYSSMISRIIHIVLLGPSLCVTMWLPFRQHLLAMFLIALLDKTKLTAVLRMNYFCFQYIQVGRYWRWVTAIRILLHPRWEAHPRRGPRRYRQACRWKWMKPRKCPHRRRRQRQDRTWELLYRIHKSK